MEHVVQFDTKRRTLPGLDIPLRAPRKRGILRGSGTGGAWLSSARVVRRLLKCSNERNPRPVLNYSRETAVLQARRKERTTSSQHVPYVQGYTHPTMGRTTGRDGATLSKSFKPSLSSDCRLKFACMKPELVVIVGQQTAVNTFSLLVHTARQASEVGSARSAQWALRRGQRRGLSREFVATQESNFLEKVCCIGEAYGPI